MVRHKKRWLLVQLHVETPHQQQQASKIAASSFNPETQRLAGKILKGRLTQKELHVQLRETFLSCFGVAGVAAASYDTQVRWMDIETTQLALIRCSREWSGHVRAALTFWNSLPPQKQPPPPPYRSGDGSKQKQPRNNNVAATANSRLLVTASVVSVHGSARTAKLATMARVRSHFRQRLELQRRLEKISDDQSNRKQSAQTSSQDKDAVAAAAGVLCKKMESMLRDLDKIDAEQYYIKDENTATATSDNNEDDE